MRIFLVLLFLFPIFAQATIPMAITFDDLTMHGALPPGSTRLEITKKILSVLKKHKITEAYGFINAGKLLEDASGREQLQLWRKAGYPLGNHTYTHPNLKKTSVEDFQKEIAANEAALKEFSGDMDWKFFRYPFLNEGESPEKRNAIRKYLSEHGYKIAQVTVDFEDWAWNDPYARCMATGDKKSIRWLKKTYLKNAEANLDRAVKLSRFVFKKDISHVLLPHVGAFDAEMLDALLTSYKKKGVKFIPLAEAQKDEIYSVDPGFTFAHGAELQYQVLKSRGIKASEAGFPALNLFPEKELERICL
jgi:peptidoglycan/xylan/chitin deacetylase (PgdA/CDA1 family)